MAVPTFTSPPTTINAADVATNWLILVTPDPDFKKEGSNAMSGTLRNDLATGQYGPVTGISMANQHMRCWVSFAAVQYLAAEASGGMEFWVTDGTNTAYYVIFGSDTYLGGWKNCVINFEAPTSGTKPTGNVTTWGLRFHRTAAPRQVVNTWIDALRYGDGYTITGGSSGDKVALTNIYALDVASAYGVLDRIEGVYFGYGKLIFGNGATTTYISIDGQVLIFTNSKVASGLYGLVGQGSGCNIVINASVIQSAGTTDATRFAVDMDEANLSAFTMTSSFITKASTCTFKSGQTVTANTFDNCGQITAGGADFRNSIVKNYGGAADSSALIWDVNADVDGKLDSMSFTKGSTATHAITLGTTSPTSLTLRKITFSGYNAADAQNDSVLYVARTGGTVTINVVQCVGTVTYKSAGATVTLVQDSVSATVTVLDTSVPPVAIESARVLLLAANGGPMPYDVTVTITNSSTTATVTHTTHGMATNDKVQIKGASLWQNNGVFTITKINDNSYSYTMPEAPGSNPTGTIKATYVALEGLTDSNGQKTMSRVFTSSQPITGRVRKSSANPYYKTTDLTGTINSASGYSATVQLQLDT